MNIHIDYKYNTLKLDTRQYVNIYLPQRPIHIVVQWFIKWVGLIFVHE